MVVTDRRVAIEVFTGGVEMGAWIVVFSKDEFSESQSTIVAGVLKDDPAQAGAPMRARFQLIDD